MLYLASQSPRRAELLRQLRVAFTAIAGPDIDESHLPGERARDYVQRIVHEKCAAVLRREMQNERTNATLGEGDCVLVADTTVSVDSDGADNILGKPANEVEAIAMLRALSGRSHQVITGVAVATQLFSAVRTASILQISTVTFATLSDHVIARYVATGEPYDKAGGYGIQGPAGGLISHLEGSFTGVMGLPLFETGQLLKQFNLEVMSP